MQPHYSPDISLADRLLRTQKTLAGGAALIGVSKGQPVSVLAEAMRLGLADFGENRVQEAVEKWSDLPHHGVTLHLIGPLQTNKVREAVALFDVIHTLDRPKLADALATEIHRSGKTPRLLIQVNTGEEPQKAGVAPHELPGLLSYSRGLGLNVVGLMCVPPHDQHPAPHFALLAKLAARHGLPELSMGMSGDYETALRLGATMVRVGTALFGPRLTDVSPPNR